MATRDDTEESKKLCRDKRCDLLEEEITMDEALCDLAELMIRYEDKVEQCEDREE